MPASKLIPAIFLGRLFLLYSGSRVVVVSILSISSLVFISFFIYLSNKAFNLSVSIGLVKKASIPLSKDFSLSCFNAPAVNPTTSVCVMFSCASNLRNFSVVSLPSNSGIWTSMKTRSGCSVTILSNASFPFTASIISTLGIIFLIRLVAKSILFGLSSAISIL